MKKRICYVVTIPLTIRAFFIPQIKYLSKQGFDVTVVCSNDRSQDLDIIFEELKNSAHIEFVDMPRGLSFFGSLKSVFKLAKYFRKGKFDLIQYSTPNASLYASIASFLAGCRVRNYHLMGFRFLCEKHIDRFILKSMEKLTCRFSTSIECVSRSNLDLGIQLRIFKKKKATVVWNGSSGGVDLKRFDISKRDFWRAELRKENGYRQDDFVFGFVGRITKDKGINELIEAFLSLDNDTKLFIIGNYENDGSVNPKLWKKAISADNIIIHEPTNDIERYYAMIDVLVFPSHREGFGNVIIEAAAVGTPAIVADIPGPRDCVIDNETGWFFSLSDTNALAELMKNVVHADCLKFGEDARMFIENSFDSDLLCEKICERKKLLLS